MYQHITEDFSLWNWSNRSYHDSSSESHSLLHEVTCSGDDKTSVSQSSNSRCISNNNDDDESSDSNEIDFDDDPSYAKYFFETFDTLVSKYALKKASSLAGHIARRCLTQQSVIQDAIRMVGGEAVYKLAIIGSIQGTNIRKISKNIQVSCHGEKAHGIKTIKQLVEAGIVSKRGSKNDTSQNKIHLNLIATALPHAAFQSMVANLNNDVSRRKCRYVIETTLPVELQYLAACCLPLGTKTRKAHIYWTSKFLGSIHSKFNPTIYKRQMKQSVAYEKIEWLKEKLDRIEACLSLKSEEEAIQPNRFFKKYYAIKRKENTNA